MVSPASSTDFEWRAHNGDGQQHQRPRLPSRRAPGRNGSCAWKKSTTTVEDSEFSAALKLAMAAARIAAISSPASPGGRLFQMNSG